MKHRSVLTGFSRPYSNIQDTGCSWYSDSIKDKDLNGFALQLEPSFVDLMLRFELSKLSVAKFTLPRKLFAVQSCIRRRFAAGLMLRRHLQSFETQRWTALNHTASPGFARKLCQPGLHLSLWVVGSDNRGLPQLISGWRRSEVQTAQSTLWWQVRSQGRNNLRVGNRSWSEKRAQVRHPFQCCVGLSFLQRSKLPCMPWLACQNQAIPRPWFIILRLPTLWPN